MVGELGLGDHPRGIQQQVLENAVLVSGEIDDGGWTSQEIDLTGIADNEPEVWIRWTMGSTDESVTYCGWNIDDIRILEAGPGVGCQTAPGETMGLMVWADAATLDWSPPADLGGAVAPVFDVVRSSSPADFISSALCIEGDDGAWILDLNRATNPYCAYGDPSRFACPVPPTENKLPIAVMAGERAYRPASTS